MPNKTNVLLITDRKFDFHRQHWLYNEELMIQRGKEPEWGHAHSGSFPRPIFRAFFVKL